MRMGGQTSALVREVDNITCITLQSKENVQLANRVSESYQSLTAHQHQKGHTVPKQVITIAMLIQVTTV